MTADMLAAFDRLKAQVDRTYEAARDRLADHDLTAAQALLSRLGETHTRAALLMGNCLAPCIVCGKGNHDGTEGHELIRTDTLRD
ncbi:hypothetical protein [Micromonospora haikouensis]|uniref:Uncharacterized protein n=1 Tax=Micromonospora haikouensis TaxID=686309 RepID=A0A0D0V122_9ACTN|nr:hypothetical protein [Micromonospora haikouensis]KIR64742.1 hypothetical protein TK50_03745 [Micromonospora haikouensis]